MLARIEKRLTPKQEQRAHLYALAGQLGGGYVMARRLVELESLAGQLRRRFEAQCSYQWANTEAYEKRTEKLVERAKQLVALMQVAVVEINRDPRGAAIKLQVETADGLREFYL